MKLEKQLDLRRHQAEQKRAVALQVWQQANPHLASSDTHQAAFLAGYDTAAGPLPPTGGEVMAKYAQQITEKAEHKRQRLAALPPGTCQTCEGQGEFVGTTHITMCVDCDGTGKVTLKKGGAA